MLDPSDLAFIALMLLLSIGIIHGIVTNRRARIESMDDSDPGYDDWKNGSPDDPMDPEAKPVDLNKDEPPVP